MSSHILQMLDGFATVSMDPKQSSFWAWKRDVAEEVLVESFSEVCPQYAEYIVSETQAKECYRNSISLAGAIPGAKIVLGMGCGSSTIPTEHAWLSIDGRYIDPTWELHTALDFDITEYRKFIELPYGDFVEIFLDIQKRGGFVDMVVGGYYERYVEKACNEEAN